jgi:hypothetical protein
VAWTKNSRPISAPAGNVEFLKINAAAGDYRSHLRALLTPDCSHSFSSSILMGRFDGRHNLMFRVANLRHTSMVDACFRMIFSRDERVREGNEVRRFTN